MLHVHYETQFNNSGRLRREIKALIVDDYRHQIINHPNLHGKPGSIIRVTDLGKKGYNFDVVCKPEQILGDGFKPIATNTFNNRRQLDIIINIDITARAKYLGIGGGFTGDWDNISNYLLSFENVMVESITDADIHRVRSLPKETLLTNECRSAINYWMCKKEPERLTMTRTAIVGDLTAKFDTHLIDKLDFDIDVALLLKNLNELGFKLVHQKEEEDSTSVSGTKIYLGIKGDRRLFDLASSGICKTGEG